MLKGNDKTFILNEKETIQFELFGVKSDRYEIESLVGTSFAFELNIKDKVYSFVLKSELSLLQKDLEIYTNVITVMSKFVMLNKLEIPIFIGLQENLSLTSEIMSHQEASFYFWGKKPNKNVCFNFVNIYKDPGWSKGICLKDYGIHYIYINKSKVIIENKIENSVTHLIISQGHNENFYYDDLIINNEGKQMVVVPLSPNFAIFELNLRVKKIGISLVSDNRSQDKEFSRYIRKEILFSIINDFELHFYQTFEGPKSASGRSEIEFQLKHLEIHNKLKTQYPIMLRPKSDKHEKIDNNPFFMLSMVEKINENERVKNIEIIKYLIQSFELNLDMNLIEHIITFVTNITSFLKTNVIDINPVFTLVPRVQLYTVDHISSNVLIKTLSISNFNIYLSVNSHDQSDFFQKLLSGFLAGVINVFATINNTKFKLAGGTFNNIYGDYSDLFSLISNQYKKSLGSHFWKIAGSSFSNFFKELFGTNDDNKNMKVADLSIVQKYFTNKIEANDFKINIPLFEIAREGFGSGLCMDISKLFSLKNEMESISKNKTLDVNTRKARTFYGKYKFVRLKL